MTRGITSVQGLIQKVFAFAHEPNDVVFYRGHSNREKYKLEPSLYRKPQHVSSEHLLFRELLISNPSEFANDVSTFEKLVRMQHYSMPTRLLDITSNPLMALYFACKSNPDSHGDVITFRVKRDDIKFFDSDTASCIANLARLPGHDKNAIDFTLAPEPFNESLPITRLLHFVREEKSFFVGKIDPTDLKRIICVKGKMNNKRIVSQSGAFLLFGLDASLGEEGDDKTVISRVLINAAKKVKILKELDSLNINESTVFPYIENSARYIARKYEI